MPYFDATRYWAYAQDTGDDRDTWVERCKAWARQERLRFPDLTDFPESEANQIGYRVAGWTWEKYSPDHRHRFDHSIEAQTWRGLRSGAARRRTMKSKRDRARALRAEGLGPDAIAEQVGVSRRTVFNYLRG